MAVADQAAYEAEIRSWRQSVEDKLRAETGWLTLTGLYWLHDGENSLGSDPSSDILLPESAPKQVGFIDFSDGKATLRTPGAVEVMVKGVPTEVALLRDDADPTGPTRIEIGSVNFHVIKRGDQYGIRVRDRNNPARQTFKGCVWFPIDPTYRVTATFTAHPVPPMLDIVTVAGVVTPIENPGSVTFELAGQSIRLEAFREDNDELWFVFRDASPLTYHAARFLYSPNPNADGTVTLDFNKAKNPPCAFTPYATCPLPVKQNILAIPIDAGEQMPEPT